MSERDDRIETIEPRSGPARVPAAETPDRLTGLLVAIAAGDRTAFEELYRLTSAKLFGVCLRILSRRPDAEEALQDCYLTIWRNAARFDAERGSAIAWLVALARNRAIDRLRAARAGTAPEASAEDGQPDPHVQHRLRMLRRDLADCLRLLDTRDAAFITTAFFRGDTYADLAQAGGLPLGTVKTRIRRALLKLRACLA